jgi:hypothetical protein
MAQSKSKLREWWYAHNALRDLVWAWDPIGLGEDIRPKTEDEYDCILDKVYPMIRRQAPLGEIALVLNDFLPHHFSIRAQPEGAALFAGRALAWWRANATKGP